MNSWVVPGFCCYFRAPRCEKEHLSVWNSETRQWEKVSHSVTVLSVPLAALCESILSVFGRPSSLCLDVSSPTPLCKRSSGCLKTMLFKDASSVGWWEHSERTDLTLDRNQVQWSNRLWYIQRWHCSECRTGSNRSGGSGETDWPLIETHTVTDYSSVHSSVLPVSFPECQMKPLL